MKNENKAIHGLSDGKGLFWSLRSLVSPSRDITLAPEEGVFVAETVDTEIQRNTSPKPAGSRKSHHTYGIGGQLAQIYTQTLGREFAALA